MVVVIMMYIHLGIRRSRSCIQVPYLDFFEFILPISSWCACSVAAYTAYYAGSALGKLLASIVYVHVYDRI